MLIGCNVEKVWVGGSGPFAWNTGSMEGSKRSEDAQVLYGKLGMPKWEYEVLGKCWAGALRVFKTWSELPCWRSNLAMLSKMNCSNERIDSNNHQRYYFASAILSDWILIATCISVLLYKRGIWETCLKHTVNKQQKQYACLRVVNHCWTTS